MFLSGKTKIFLKLFPCALLLASFSVVTKAQAACTGNYPHPIDACALVTNTVHIGNADHTTLNISAPLALAAEKTEYILDGNIIADGTAIQIGSGSIVSGVVLNLSGYTITYNKTVPGYGVAGLVYARIPNTAITNGTIIQHPSYDSDAPRTTIVAALDQSQTTFDVADATGFIVGRSLVSGKEMMLLNSISGNTLTVARHTGSGYVSHLAGEEIYMTKSEGTRGGVGSNPLWFVQNDLSNLQITDMNVIWGGRDASGLYGGATNGKFQYNTFQDLFTIGTLKDRTYGVAAMQGSASGSLYEHNTIITARHRGIVAATGDEIRDNTIGIDVIGTNGFGIVSGGGVNVKIHDNDINAYGSHPIGIFAASVGGADANVDIYNNTITAQATALDDEYTNDITPCLISNSPTTGCPKAVAAGFRTTWGGNGIKFHDNPITIYADAAKVGRYVKTGEPVLLNGYARGIWAGINANESAIFYDNDVTVLDVTAAPRSGTGVAEGIVVAYNCPTCTPTQTNGLSFVNNTVTSNIRNVALGNDYNNIALGFPQFIQNTFVKADNYPAYHVISDSGTFYDPRTGIFISNDYQGGASISDTAGMGWSSPNQRDIIFGRLMTGTVRDSSNVLLANARIRTFDNSSTQQTEVVTDGNGEAQFTVYDYKLSNNLGATGSQTPITTVFAPHTINLFNLTTSADLFTTAPDNSTAAWDYTTGSGTRTLSNANASILIDMDGAPSVSDTTAPSAPQGLAVQ